MRSATLGTTAAVVLGITAFLLSLDEARPEAAGLLRLAVVLLAAAAVWLWAQLRRAHPFGLRAEAFGGEGFSGLELLQGQLGILERIAGGAPLAGTLEAITRLVEAYSPDMLASILLVDEADHVRVGAAPSLPAWYSRAIEGQSIGPAAGSCGTAAYRRQEVTTPDIANDPLWLAYRDAALRAGLAASWSTPLFDSEGRVVGTLAYYYRRPQDPRPKDRRIAGAATRLAEIAIARPAPPASTLAAPAPPRPLGAPAAP